MACSENREKDLNSYLQEEQETREPLKCSHKQIEIKMPVPGSMYGANQGPTCFQKMKTGFTIGFCVGMASGALFGGFSALRYVLT